VKEANGDVAWRRPTYATIHRMIESAPQAQERKVRDELTDRAQAA